MNPHNTAAAATHHYLLQVSLVLLLIFINALFSLAEYGLITVRRTRIQQLAEEGNRSAEMVLEMLRAPTVLMATLQSGITIVATLSSGLAAEVGVQPVAAMISNSAPSLPARPLALLIIALPVAIVSLVIGEIAPKSFAVRHSERIALLAVRPVWAVQVVMSPVIKILTFLANVVLRPLGGSADFSTATVNEDEIKILVDASEEQGGLEPEEKEMIHSVLDFGDTVVRKVMTPRIFLSACPATADTSRLIRLINESGHSRIPVYEGDLDHIVGIVHAKDLLLPNATLVPVPRKVMRPPYFIPESKKIDELLTEFRHSRQQLAIVQDEYGITSGLVSIEDLLEEIVGEIQDEYDREEPMIQEIDAMTTLVDGRMSLSDINDHLGLHLAEHEADTIGGYLFALFGRQAQQGEEAECEGIRFIVEATDGRRILKVKLIRQPEENVTSDSLES
jgi:putative hemolysin